VSIVTDPEQANQAFFEVSQSVEMVLIPAGEFLMGSAPGLDQAARADEYPQCSLYLPDYHLAKAPVTRAQYAAFVQATDYRQPTRRHNGQPATDKQDHPVIYVSWDDAVAFCHWLSEDTGLVYRLPTEAEWEKAARGTSGRIYPWGNHWDTTRCNTPENGINNTTPVAAYPDGASPYGLLDMVGNVWEWCATQLGKTYPYDVGQDEWCGAYLQGDVNRAVRGGSFYDYSSYARCASRWFEPHWFKGKEVGFRVALAAP
jgi:formylglycine-generating enzyme required for sulfatase activity